MTALLATYVSIKTMADGTPRITLDMDCSLADVAAMGLMPGVAFGIARITGESTLPKFEQSTPTVEPEESKQKAGPLCVLSCSLCKQPEFWTWANYVTNGLPINCEADAKAFVLETCGIESRKELDTSSRAAASFHHQIRIPFIEWRA